MILLSSLNFFNSQEVKDSLKPDSSTEKVSVKPRSVTGVASWYGGKHHGRRTASGEVFDQFGMTCASNVHKLGTRLRVTNPENGNSVIVRVTDRGGFTKMGRLLDLSRGAFAKLTSISKGLIRVKVEVLD